MAAVIAVAVIWAGYGFRYAARPAGMQINPPIESTLGNLSPVEGKALTLMAHWKLLPESWLLIGSGRRRMSDDDFRDHVHGVLGEFGPKPEDGPWEEFASRLRFADRFPTK